MEKNLYQLVPTKVIIAITEKPRIENFCYVSLVKNIVKN